MIFKFKKNALLVTRIGSPNPVRQKGVLCNGPKKRVTPVTRGIWVFPWPIFDKFFTWHQVSEKLPKKFNQGVISDEEWEKINQEELWEERRLKEKQIDRTICKKKNLWWDKPFYSRIENKCQHPIIHDNDGYERHWYLWNSARDWAEEANKQLCSSQRFGNELCTFKHSADHLELFLPMCKLP